MWEEAGVIVRPLAPEMPRTATCILACPASHLAPALFPEA